MNQKENPQALLIAPIDWEQANLFRPDDNVAYIGIDAKTIGQAKHGTRFRCYFAPIVGVSQKYRLVLFEVGAYRDPIRKTSGRGYIARASMEFEQDIWGQQIYEFANA